MKFCVMLSTYNGEKYIKEQIESILSQEKVDVDLYIRDDGSQDDTVRIVEELKKQYAGSLHFERGRNVGYAKSFFSLLCSAPDDYDYYAFSDQDDIWKINKLSDAEKSLTGKIIPCLYSCNLELVDENLNHIGNMEPPNRKDFEKGRYLVDRYSYGCTMVFNPELRRLAVNNLPQIDISHDNWLGMIAVFCGEFIFENKFNIKYRQHGRNVTGGKSGIIYSWKRRLRNISRISDESRCALAKEMLVYFIDRFDEETIDLLEMVANYKDGFAHKMRFFFDKRTIRKSREKNLLFRIMILLSLA